MHLYAEHAPYGRTGCFLRVPEDGIDGAEVAGHELDLRRFSEKLLCRCRLCIACECEDLERCIGFQEGVDDGAALFAGCACDEEGARCHCRES